MTNYRLFIVGGTGFVLGNAIEPILRLDPEIQLTLLLLTHDQRAADHQLKNFLDAKAIQEKDRHRVRAIAGDLRSPFLGLDSISDINSNHWLCGTMPFRFGPRRQASEKAATELTENLLQSLDCYSSTVEPVEKYTQLSSIRVGGATSERLPASLSYSYTPFGNFDTCKRLVERRLQTWLLESPRRVRSVLVPRIGSLLSTDMNRIGGGILTLARELLGFGRARHLPRNLYGDRDGIIRVLPARLVGEILATMLPVPDDGIKVVNLVDNGDLVTVDQFHSLMLSLRGEITESLDSRLHLVSVNGAVDTHGYEYWLRSNFAWLTSSVCTKANPQTSITDDQLAKARIASSTSSWTAITLLEDSLRAAIAVGFEPLRRDLGESPIY